MGEVLNKYHAKKQTVDGITFDSGKEASRYCELKLRQRDKNNPITDLKLQVPFVCEVNHRKICTYKADFVYKEGGRAIVEDTKGYRTDVYKLKKKLVEALYGIEILET